jgi:N,N'-diacetyllegionaminate synthase
MKDVVIGNKTIGGKKPCILSLEIGATFVNVPNAKILIDAISSSNADAVKFQTIFPGETDRLIGKRNLEINYTTSSGTKTQSVYDALKSRELSLSSWTDLVNYTHSCGLLFITSPEFIESVDLISEMNVDAIKIAKGDINNSFLIEKVAKTKIPIILDGREKFEDVKNAISICEQNKNYNIVIMHCPSGYPAEYSGIHLNAISEIRSRCDYPVGFSDHSTGDSINYAAIGLGVNMIEKTLTMNKNTESIEHFMSLEINELKDFVYNIRNVENALGDSKILDNSRVDESVRRSFTVKADLKKGQKITPELLDFKRPGNAGISVSLGSKVLSKIAKQDISKDSFLQWDMLE